MWREDPSGALGAIVQIDDDAHDDWFIDNASIDATQTFAYDALGRLIQATGRERDSQTYGYGPPTRAEEQAAPEEE